MNMNPNDAQLRTDATIDAVLSGEEELIPSSGFLISVMERVRQEAATSAPIPFAAPASIPFPWKRAFPGIVLAALVLGYAAYQMFSLALPAMHQFTLSVPHFSIALIQLLQDAAWVALALGSSLATSLLSRRFAGHGGLL
jgi:hypothetical protein